VFYEALPEEIKTGELLATVSHGFRCLSRWGGILRRHNCKRYWFMVSCQILGFKNKTHRWSV